MSSPLLIVGASVRACAQSALKAGFVPFAIDMFADLDLREIAQTRRCERYPDDLPRLASELTAAPFLYTGALENSPQILRALQSARPLWGNGENTLRLVRDPVWVQEILLEEGFPALATRRTPPTSGDASLWLRKPLASAAGLGIDFESDFRDSNKFYWQQFVSGIPISASFLADDRKCQLIGTAEQWVGCPGFPVGPFQFCGAIVPAQISELLRADLELIGTRFAERAGLRGLFGIDLIHHDLRVYVVEINPRPTATLELYERVFDRSFLKDHANVFQGIEAPPLPGRQRTRTAAKMLLYAPQTGRTPHLELWKELNGHAEYPAVADLPEADQPLAIGQPVCSILADGPSEEHVLNSLRMTAERVTQEIGWTVDFGGIVKGLKLG